MSQQPKACCYSYSNIVPVSLRQKDGSWYLAWKCLGCEGLYDIQFNTTRKVILVQEVHPVSDTVLDTTIDTVEHYPLDSFQLKNLLEVGINIFVNEQDAKLVKGTFAEDMNCPNCNYEPITSEEDGEKYITCKVCGTKYLVRTYLSGNTVYERVINTTPVTQNEQEQLKQSEELTTPQRNEFEDTLEEKETEHQVTISNLSPNTEHMRVDEVDSEYDQYEETTDTDSVDEGDTIPEFIHHEELYPSETPTEDNEHSDTEYVLTDGTEQDTLTINPEQTTVFTVPTSISLEMPSTCTCQKHTNTTECSCSSKTPYFTFILSVTKKRNILCQNFCSKTETEEYKIFVIYYYNTISDVTISKDTITNKYILKDMHINTKDIFDEESVSVADENDIVILSESTEKALQTSDSIATKMIVMDILATDKKDKSTYFSIYIELCDTIRYHVTIDK